MPFVSDQDLAIVRQNIVSRDNKIAALKSKCERDQVTNKALVVGQGWAGGAAIGFLRGKFEDPATGTWNLPGTQVDIEMLALVALAGVALAGDSFGLKKYQGHAAAVAAGVGGHYAGQVARKFARTGKLSLVAGAPSVGALPQYDPVSYNPTQYSAPYGDPVDQALSSAGV